MKKDYSSPRWSMEITDCSMPMTMDTYSVCSYNCLYCFAYFQKSHTVDGYLNRDVRSVNPQKVIDIFEAARGATDKKLSEVTAQFIPYIRGGRIMQWGGMADQFDEYERKHGITLALLRYFDAIDYPLSFSTKGTWWTEDSRYMELFAKHAHNWHTKISIITADEKKARRMEKGVPGPAERFAAIKRLAEQGNRVTLRLRPYIIGLSEDYETSITEAHKAGADSVTTEFFCMESRANEQLKARYAEMSEICKFDIWKFYMAQSKQMGYKRLSKAIKAPIIHKMRDFAHSLGLRFHVSDAACRECNDACNCCGVPPEWGVSQTGHIGNAIIIAREKGEVRFSDISDPMHEYFNFSWVKACGFNTGSNRARALLYDTTMTQWLRSNWNNTKAANSPAKAYGAILTPAGRDENGDVIYKYTPERGNTHGGTKGSKDSKDSKEEKEGC